MTRKELAIAIYRLDTKKGMTGRCSEKEYVKRALYGVGSAKPFLKSELQEMYDRRIAEVEFEIK